MSRSLSLAAAVICAMLLSSTSVEAGGCLFGGGASYGPGYFTSYHGGSCAPCSYNPVNYIGVPVSNCAPAPVSSCGSCGTYCPTSTCGTHCPTYTACPTTTCGYNCAPRRGCFLSRGLFGRGYGSGCGTCGGFGYSGCGCGW